MNKKPVSAAAMAAATAKWAAAMARDPARAVDAAGWAAATAREATAEYAAARAAEYAEWAARTAEAARKDWIKEIHKND